MKNSVKTFILLLATVFVASSSFAQESYSLKDVIDITLKNNFDILIGEKNVEISKINNNPGAAGKYPTVSLTGTNSNAVTTDDGDVIKSTNNSASVGFNWTLFNGFYIKNRIAQLEELEELSEGNSVVIVENTIQSVVLAYYNVILQEKTSSVYELIAKLSKDRYDYAQSQKDLGSITTFELLQAKTSYLEDKANYLSQISNIDKAKRELKLLMADESNTLPSVSGDLEIKTSDYKLDQLLAKMINNNTTLKNQFINISMIEKDIALAESRLYPTVAMNGGVQSQYNKITDMNATSGTNLYAGFTLSYNIFSGGTTKQAINIAKVNREIGDLNTKSIKLTLTNTLSYIFDQYQIAKELITVAEESLAAAKLNFELGGEKFKNGSINSFNYRDIQLIYLNSSLQALQMRYNLISQELQLTRLTGGIIEQSNNL